jgi:hypothetical protein
LAGGLVDAGGFALDTVTGTVSNFGHSIGRGFGCIANVVGGITAKSKYVDFDDISALDEYTDEEMANMSQSEIMRHEGIFGFAAHHAMKFFSPVIDMGTDVASDTVNFFQDDKSSSDVAAEDAQSNGGMRPPSEDSPAWYANLYGAYSGGMVSEDQLTTISAGIASGIIDVDALDAELAAVGGSGSMAPWSDIATLTEQEFSANGLTSVDVLETLDVVDSVQSQTESQATSVAVEEPSASSDGASVDMEMA